MLMTPGDLWRELIILMTHEDVILVDAGDHEIGTEEKLKAHQRGHLHRAFSVIIWDGRGRLLLQRRQINKYHSGGLWTNSCCGHPRPGEQRAQAAMRRLGEEMGIRSTRADRRVYLSRRTRRRIGGA